MRKSWAICLLVLGSWSQGAILRYIDIHEKPVLDPIILSDVNCVWDKNSLEIKAAVEAKGQTRLVAPMAFKKLPDAKTNITLDMDSELKDTPILKFTDYLNEVWTSEFDNDPKSTWRVAARATDGKLNLWISGKYLKVETNKRYSGVLSLITDEKSPFVCPLPDTK